MGLSWCSPAAQPTRIEESPSRTPGPCPASFPGAWTFGLLGIALCLFLATSSAHPELTPPLHILRLQEAPPSSIPSTVSSCGTASPVGYQCCVLGQLRTPRRRKTSGRRGPCLGLQPSRESPSTCAGAPWSPAAPSKQVSSSALGQTCLLPSNPPF